MKSAKFDYAKTKDLYEALTALSDEESYVKVREHADAAPRGEPERPGAGIPAADLCILLCLLL